jgi:hypothetical protein
LGEYSMNVQRMGMSLVKLNRWTGLWVLVSFIPVGLIAQRGHCPHHLQVKRFLSYLPFHCTAQCVPHVAHKVLVHSCIGKLYIHMYTRTLQFERTRKSLFIYLTLHFYFYTTLHNHFTLLLLLLRHTTTIHPPHPSSRSPNNKVTSTCTTRQHCPYFYLLLSTFFQICETFEDHF